MKQTIVEQIRALKSLIRLRNAAVLAGRSKATLTRYIKTGTLAAVKMNGYWMIDPQVLADFIETRTVTGTR